MNKYVPRVAILAIVAILVVAALRVPVQAQEQKSDLDMRVLTIELFLLKYLPEKIGELHADHEVRLQGLEEQIRTLKSKQKPPKPTLPRKGILYKEAPDC